MKRLLVIRLGALGDLVHLSPSLASVKAMRPGLEIHCLTSPAYVPLLSVLPSVDRLWTMDKLAGWPGLFRLAGGLRAAGIDGIVNLHPSLKTLALAALLTLGRSPVPQAVYRKQKLREKGVRQRPIPRRHAAEDFYEPFRRLLSLPAADPGALIPRLPALPPAESGALISHMPGMAQPFTLINDGMPAIPGEPDADKAIIAKRPGERLIGIIPGVGGKRGNRAWPPTHYMALIRALLEAPGNRIVLIGGPDERELGEMLRHETHGEASGLVKAATEPVVSPVPASGGSRKGGRDTSPQAGSARLENHCGRHDLRGTIRLLAQCNLVIGGDTGPMHLAAALGVPLAGIYGPTSVARTGPLGTQPMRLLTPPGSLACWPCELPACPLRGDQHLACMRDIHVETVLEACQRILDGSAGTAPMEVSRS